MSAVEVPDDANYQSDDKIGHDIEKSSIQDQDVRYRQEFKGWTLFLLAFQSVG